MGYKSDVRIITTEEGFNILNNNINYYLKRIDGGLGNNLLTILDVNKHKLNNQRYFGWNNISWYTHLHYKNIDALMSGLKKLQEDNIPFRFTRIGEDVTDIEEIINDDNLKLNYIEPIRKFVD